MASSVQESKYRSHMYGEGEKDTVWRYGAPPNYDAVDKLFEEGRTQVIYPVSTKRYLLTRAI